MNFKINSIKKISITETLIIINVLVFAIMYLFNLNTYFVSKFSSMGYIWELTEIENYYRKTSKTIFNLEYS